MTKDELLTEAARIGADVRPSWSKDRIAAAIAAHQRSAAAHPTPEPGATFGAADPFEATGGGRDVDGGGADALTGAVGGDMRSQAAALGLAVGADWSDDQIAQAVAVASQIEADGPPPAVRRRWSPRG